MLPEALAVRSSFSEGMLMAGTETVTVILTDLLGSTEPASGLGHDRDEALRRHVSFTVKVLQST